MYQSTTQLRVRYAETDQMGYVYYGNYAMYYEVARVEVFRNLGFSYKQLEDMDIGMPVQHMHVDYKKPARYDELLTIKVIVPELPSVRMVFRFEIYNENDELINTCETVLFFMNLVTGRPTRPPVVMLQMMQPFFGN